jgi:CheY-like chemotaxis protein
MRTEEALTTGSSLIAERKYAAAADILAEPVRFTPENLRAWFLYGVALFKLGRYSDAEQALEHAFDLDYRQSTVVKTILLVNDDGNLRSLLKFFIEDRLPGYAVELAADGVEALVKIARSKPAVLVLDYMMPKMDGINVLRHIASDGDRYPVIFTSAHEFTPESIAARTGLPVEQVAFLHLPFMPNELEKLLQDATRRIR